MRLLPFNKKTLTLIVFSVYSSLSFGQTAQTTVIQDPKFENLLNERTRLTDSKIEESCYEIQIFSGERATAESKLYEFKKQFTDIDATIIFNSPNYKVRVGKFKTLIEAKRNLISVQEIYEMAYIIKP